jgi:hypothetical protein
MSPVSEWSRASKIRLAFLVLLPFQIIIAVQPLSKSHDVARTTFELIAGVVAGFVASFALFVELKERARIRLAQRESSEGAFLAPEAASSLTTKVGRWARIAAPCVGIAIAGPLAGSAVFSGALVGMISGMLGSPCGTFTAKSVRREHAALRTSASERDGQRITAARRSHAQSGSGSLCACRSEPTGRRAASSE